MPFYPLPERLLAKANNELTYFTGKSCKRGHVSNRYVLGSSCVECVKYKGKLNAVKYRATGRKWELKKNYGITLEQYNKLNEKQNGLCAICDQPEKTLSNFKTQKVLAVDHCHKTNKIRGLLCFNCNVGIGKFEHNSKLLRKAALYCEVV